MVSLVGVMPAAHVADHLGRKWTIVPSCLGLAAALCIMAKTGKSVSEKASPGRPQAVTLTSLRGESDDCILPSSRGPSIANI